MICAIYPRKSKANDNSQSMEQQIADCKKYINEHYPDSTIRVYDADYALTGHSTAKRKDFQRMMNDVRNGEIQLVPTANMVAGDGIRTLMVWIS